MSSVSSFEVIDSPHSSSECSTVIQFVPIRPSLVVEDDFSRVQDMEPVIHALAITSRSPSPVFLDQDAEFFIEDDMAIFCIQNCLFKVHRFFLDRESSIFPKGTGSKAQPIELPGVTRLEFKSLLNFFYNGMHNTTIPSLDQWVALLSISTRFEMSKVRNRAISEITLLRGDIDPVDQIVLAQKYGVPEWLSDAYIALCEREQPLAAYEARKLEGDIPYMVAEAREAVLKAQLVDLKAGCRCPSQTPVSTQSSSSPSKSFARTISPKNLIVRQVVDEVFGREERAKEAERLAKEQELAEKMTKRLQEEKQRREREKLKKLKEAKEAKERAEEEILRMELGDEFDENLVMSKGRSRRGRRSAESGAGIPNASL